MLNLDEINGEIAQLENRPTTYATIERLAWLYIVRDHNTLAASPPAVAVEQTVPEGKTEFCRACAGKPIRSVMDVMDELMDTLHVVEPRLYNAVLQKLY